MKTQADNYQNAERAIESARFALDDCWPLADRLQRERLVIAHDLMRRAKDEVRQAGLTSKEQTKNSCRNVMGGI